MLFNPTILYRSLQVSALMWLSVSCAVGQGFSDNIPDTGETPLERAKRARQELMQRMQNEATSSGAIEETLVDRIARLKRELAEAEAELASQEGEAAAASVAEIDSGALVVISAAKSEGSGFIAEMRGRTFLITNIHVLGSARGASIHSLDGVAVSLPSHCYVSRQRDIAIVPIEWSGPTLQISQSLSFDEVKIGQAVTVMGNSDGAQVATRLSGEIRGVGPNELEVSAKFVPGNSGSPIVHDELGKVVGIASYLRDFSHKTKWTQDSEMADVRRFGYRLDGEIDWAVVDLSDLYTQGEAYHRFEDRTQVMSHIGYMLDYEDKLMTGYSSHNSLGYLFEYFDREFQWQRGTNSSHNQRLLKRFIAGMLIELQSDRKDTLDKLKIDFYRRRYNSIQETRDEVVQNLVRFSDSRLD